MDTELIQRLLKISIDIALVVFVIFQLGIAFYSWRKASVMGEQVNTGFGSVLLFLHLLSNIFIFITFMFVIFVAVISG